MNKKYLAGILLGISMCCISCDDSTSDIGSSLTIDKDRLEIASDTFDVTTRSIVANHVLAKNTTGYVGRIIDPETKNYITGDFSTQFHILENYDLLPPDSNLVLNSKDKLEADSCELRLYYDESYGDTLSPMKLTAYELGKPLADNVDYYSDFDPQSEGYVRTGNGAKQEKMYTLTDMTEEDSIRNSSNYTHNIRIPLNKPYYDKFGNYYKNFGTYILQTYKRSPEYFKDSYTFAQKVCPGFFFKNKNGVGSMAYVSLTQLRVYYKYHYTDSIKHTVTGVMALSGTEEVLQTTKFTNDNTKLQDLANDKTCTYIKSPAGIFTEVELPIEEIMRNHENDTLNTAKIVFTRINNETDSKYELPAPATLLMLPKDSLESFFKNNEIADYRKSFLASYNSQNNNYSFNNISGLVTAMYQAKKSGTISENWNKAVIVPVTTTYSTSSTSTSTQVLVKVVNDMSLTSTRLVGGENNKYADVRPVKISVIYSKFK